MEIPGLISILKLLFSIQEPIHIPEPIMIPLSGQIAIPRSIPIPEPILIADHLIMSDYGQQINLGNLPRLDLVDAFA